MKDIKDIQLLGKYLQEQDMDVKEAIGTLKKALEINPNNLRTLWKMNRFEMYIWQRLDEDNKGLLGKKIESCRRVVASKDFEVNYKKHHPTHMRPKGGFVKVDKEYQAYLLNKLVTDPRQYPFFRAKYFRNPGSKLKKLGVKLSQDVIDKVR